MIKKQFIPHLTKWAFLLNFYVIPSSVKTISFNTFNNCTKLKSFNVSEENLYYSNDEYGALFNKDKTELYFYPLGNPRLSYTVPSEVVTIEANAFVNSANLETIIITEGTTNIGGYTAAKNLINITIPSTVTAYIIHKSVDAKIFRHIA